MYRRSLPLASIILAAMLVLQGVHSARANPAAASTLSVVPHTVRLGSTPTLIGSHLPAKRYFALLLAVPDSNRPRLQQFLNALPKSDAHGNLKARFKMPVVPLCGRATIYAYLAGRSVSVHASVMLTGCKKSSGGGPPSPPKPPKTSKK